MNTLVQQVQGQMITEWSQAKPLVASRGIDQATWNALCNSIYPGAREESILMAIDYCSARKLDIMLKPVHLVPMKVNDSYRDVPMPGIGLYRMQADRSGNYAGADEPEFGPVVEALFEDAYINGKQVAVRYPEWCKYTVYKLVNGERVAYKAMEYWLENYATQKKESDCPNAMWKKRPFAQLAKCAEAQALRKGWPEIGSEPTVEEMEGKHFAVERDITPQRSAHREAANQDSAAERFYPDEQFHENFGKWECVIQEGKRTPEQIITMVETKGKLTEQQRQMIMGVAA